MRTLIVAAALIAAAPASASAAYYRTPPTSEARAAAATRLEQDRVAATAGTAQLGDCRPGRSHVTCDAALFGIDAYGAWEADYWIVVRYRHSILQARSSLFA